MSTQTKFQIGDFVRVTKCGPDGKNDFSGDPVGLRGRVTEAENQPELYAWPYKVELEGKAPELFYPDYFAEDELELVSTPSPVLPGIVTTEWGVRSPWGDKAAEDSENAHQMVTNMNNCGYDASVIWRGVTEWQVKV